MYVSIGLTRDQMFTQYKDVYRRTIEMPQRPRTFQVNYCLKVHNAHLKLLSPLRDEKVRLNN